MSKLNSLKVPSLSKLKTSIDRIDNLRDKALSSFLYLTGSRVGEVVFRFKVKNLTIEKRGERLFYVFHMYVQKRREEFYRKVGIPYDNNEELMDNILNYIKRYRLTDEDYMFEIHQRTALRLVHKWFGFNTHFMRHVRITHLFSEFGFSEQEVKQFVGWKDTRPASTYIDLNWQQTADKL